MHRKKSNIHLQSLVTSEERIYQEIAENIYTDIPEVEGEAKPIELANLNAGMKKPVADSLVFGNPVAQLVVENEHEDTKL